MMPSSLSASAQPPAVYGVNNSMQASEHVSFAAAANDDDDDGGGGWWWELWLLG